VGPGFDAKVVAFIEVVYKGHTVQKRTTPYVKNEVIWFQSYALEETQRELLVRSPATSVPD
jgi:hypothetical protein